MKYIPYKPFSVNEAWQGRRYRTPLYTKFALDVGRLIRRIRPQKPAADAPVFAHYVWGFSNSQSDIDNPVKPFQDVLFDTWQMKSKDHQVQFMIVEKTKTKKGQEFIGFHVDAKANLIEYLENVLARLKAEKDSKA